MPLSSESRKNIFNALKKVMKKHCPPLVNTKNTEDTFEVIGNTPVPYGSKKQIVDGMYFASAVARKDMVSFYFFPLYYHEKDFEKLAPESMKCLKGKTCFNFKKEEQIHEKELDTMMKKGVEAWKKNGYIVSK